MKKTFPHSQMDHELFGTVKTNPRPWGHGEDPDPVSGSGWIFFDAKVIGLARSTSGKPHVERSTSCAMAFLELHGAKVVVATIFGGEYDTEFQGVDLRNI